MAVKKYFTQEQVSAALDKLKQLPDLKPDKMTKEDVINSLKDEIVTLSTQKGYTAAEIKSALDAVGVAVSEKSIAEVIAKTKPKIKKNTSQKKS